MADTVIKRMSRPMPTPRDDGSSAEATAVSRIRRAADTDTDDDDVAVAPLQSIVAPTAKITRLARGNAIAAARPPSAPGGLQEGQAAAVKIFRSAAPSTVSSAAGPDGGPLDTGTESKIRSAGSGKPLDDALRSRIEPAFGADFSDVRIHTNSKIAPVIGAKAFTVGNHVHFADHEYDPASKGGQHVLAHELSHVVQQGGAARREPTIRRLGSAMNLMDIDAGYDLEQTTQRADLVGAITGMADVISRMKVCMDAINAAPDGDAAALTAAKERLRVVPAQSAARMSAADLADMLDSMNKIITQMVPMDKATAYAKVSGIYTNQLTKARREDVVIADDGTLDAAALAARLVVYDLTPDAQAKSTVTVSGGKLKRSATYATPNADVDTSASVTHHSGNGWEIFVVSPSGELHMASHKIGKFHHSSLLGGGTVSMAGELKVAGGVIDTMTNKSGHYSPSAEAFAHFLKTIYQQGMLLTFKVAGFGVPPGQTAGQWLTSLDTAEDAGTTGAGTKQPERLDVQTAWESYVADGKDPMKFFTDPAPGGLGWRVGAGSFEKPIGAGWVKVTHVEAREALETKWGPAKKKVRKKSGGAENFRWV